MGKILLFSVWKNLTPIPFALAVLNILNTCPLVPNVPHIGANSYHEYRPAWQAVFSVVYTSVTTVSQYYLQCRRTIYVDAVTLGNDATVLAPSHWR